MFAGFLRAKKCIVFISFSTYNSLVELFSLFVGTSTFSNASIDSLNYLLHLCDSLICHGVLIFFSGLSLMITALCDHAPYFHQLLHLNFHKIRHKFYTSNLLFFIKFVMQTIIFFFISSFIK